jgi:TetR/AcrR family transcriptional repressor of nem operon
MTLGRPLQFNPDRALDNAMQLFWRKGYESSSLQNLLDSMQLSKSSFYQTFKSKPQLFQQSIRRYRRHSTRRLLDTLSRADNARSFIETLFNNIADETDGPDARRGCLLLNTANEFAQTDPHIADIVADSLEQITSILEQAILQAQTENMISRLKNAHTLSKYLMSSMSGMKNMVKAGADRDTIRNINGIVLSALD